MMNKQVNKKKIWNEIKLREKMSAHSDTFDAASK